MAFATFLVWRLRTGGYGLALAALALVVFGAIECPPPHFPLKGVGGSHHEPDVKKGKRKERGKEKKKEKKGEKKFRSKSWVGSWPVANKKESGLPTR